MSWVMRTEVANGGHSKNQQEHGSPVVPLGCQLQSQGCRAGLSQGTVLWVPLDREGCGVGPTARGFVQSVCLRAASGWEIISSLQLGEYGEYGGLEYKNPNLWV